MTVTEQIITIAMCVLGTMLCRFLPFVLFSGKKKTPEFINYLGKALPPAIFAMLVVYCLRNVEIMNWSHGIPELIAIAATVLLHLWKRRLLLSVAGGTFAYMFLVQLIF